MANRFICATCGMPSEGEGVVHYSPVYSDEGEIDSASQELICKSCDEEMKTPAFANMGNPFAEDSDA